MGPGKQHIVYGSMVYQGDSVGLIVNSSCSSLQVYDDTTRINYEYLEDYGNSLQKCPETRFRDLINLKASLTVFPDTLLRAEENCLFLREIPTLETCSCLTYHLSVFDAYVHNRSIPKEFLDTAYTQAQHWASYSYEYLQTRIPGLFVEVLKDPEAMTSEFPSLFPGMLLKTRQNTGSARVVGVNGQPWYVPVASNPYESGREEFQQAWMLPYSWYSTHLETENHMPPPFFKIEWSMTKEEFLEEFSRPIQKELHEQIVKELDAASRSSGKLVWNLSPYCIHMDSFKEFNMTADQIYAHAGFLLLLNMGCLYVLQFITSGAPVPSREPFLSIRPFLFATTKDLIASLRIQQLRSPVTLKEDPAELPPEVKSYMFNRLGARPERLRKLPMGTFSQIVDSSEPSRWSQSITGALIRLVMRLTPATLRIGYIHERHGGQRRAFHVVFSGEGGIDNGGLYRELFRTVMQELHDVDLLPFLAHTPNYTQEAAEFGRDDYLFSTHGTPFVYEGLGRIVGTAIMSGVQLDLFLSLSVWKMTVREPVGLRDLKSVHFALWKKFTDILRCSVRQRRDIES